MLANLCLLLVSCLVSISLCEVSLRLFYPKYRHLAEAQFSRDATRIWARRANNRDWSSHPDTSVPHAYHHNNHALRQHRDFSETDLAFATNIGVFGDSFVENVGMDAPYSFTEPLDYLLNQGRKRFNVLNFGVAGYGTDQSFLHYEHFPYAEKLDYVFYVYYGDDLNDIYYSGLFSLDDTGHLARREALPSQWALFMNRFHIPYLILDVAGRLSTSIEERAVNKKLKRERSLRTRKNPRLLSETEKNSTAIFQQLIRRWKSLVERHGNTFYVVPLPDRPLDPLVSAFLREEGVNVVNLYDCFGHRDPAHLRGAWAESPYRFRNDAHWNEAGNQLAAVCLYRVLEEEVGLPTRSEDGLRTALHSYYSAFKGWRPTHIRGGVSPQTVAGIREKYQAFDGADLFEATWRAMRAAPDKRIIKSDFDVYLDRNRLVYLNEECSPAHIQASFFLHLIPVDEQDLPKNPNRVLSNFERLRPRGIKLSEERCLAVRNLPRYPLRSIRTGQYVPGGGRLWAREYSMEQKMSGEAVMEPIAREKRIISSSYDVYLDGKNIVYFKEECRPADREATFFLQVTPVDPDVIPQGFDSVHFNRCTTEHRLPMYDIRHIRTGQYVTDRGQLWKGEFAMEPASVNEGTAKRALAGKRIIQSDFDVYLKEGRLIYRKEHCGPADTSAMFFLHVVPVDRNDLSPQRAQHGFANLDFPHRSGFRLDEFGCRISHRLPAYAIRHIRTGQYLPGEEGRLWEGAFSFD